MSFFMIISVITVAFAGIIAGFLMHDVYFLKITGISMKDIISSVKSQKKEFIASKRQELLKEIKKLPKKEIEKLLSMKNDRKQLIK
jgi:hypothetical protein